MFSILKYFVYRGSFETVFSGTAGSGSGAATSGVAATRAGWLATGPCPDGWALDDESIAAGWLGEAPGEAPAADDGAVTFSKPGMEESWKRQNRHIT
jgi:hypothetical protein